MILLLRRIKNTENINPRVSNTSNSKTILLSKWAIVVIKNQDLLKKQEAKGILSSLGIKTTLLNDIWFWMQLWKWMK